jgi:flagellar biosynthetic protein FlhB
MAEQQAGNRTEQATARRREEARKKGQVALSREVPGAVVLLGGVTMMALFAPSAMTRLADLMRTWLVRATSAPTQTALSPDAVGGVMQQFGLDVAGTVWPFLAGVMVLGTGSYVAQTGLLWRTDGLNWDWERLNPVSGLERLFSVRSVAELVKSVLKVTVIGATGVLAVRQDLGRLPELVAQDPFGVLGVTAALALRMAVWIGATVALLAAADYAWQRYQWLQNLMMTKDEVKQELRETEGDPIIKARVRSLQRAMAKKRMMAEVPKADVVVTNPTHVAVALRYEHGAMPAPVVVAKGMGFIAERIKAVAKEHGVPVIEQPVIARSLYKLVEIGREIPTDLYRAVAEILAVVYRARGAAPSGRA